MLAPALALAVVGAGCAVSASETAVPVTEPATTAVAAPEPTAREVAASDLEGSGTAADAAEPVAEPSESPTPVAGPTAAPVPLGTPLPPAPIGAQAIAGTPASGPRPVSLAIDAIDVADAEVIAVGVNADETFEVPPADQVGWYRFGPTPGQAGSAVLAAHIAFDGVDGVFRHLADVDVGSVVEIGFDDGSTQRYRIETVTEYLKEELPAELFARDGSPSLALITCGGQFNRQLSSYESNVVAVAVPI